MARGSAVRARLRALGLLILFPCGNISQWPDHLVSAWDVCGRSWRDGRVGRMLGFAARIISKWNGQGRRVGCQVLQGIQDGFCGCLTTVSTWALELKGLQRKPAYLYGGISVGLGITALVVIMGTLVWTHCVSKPICST